MTCDEGTKTRTRTCAAPQHAGIPVCPGTGESDDETACNDGDCPTDVLVFRHDQRGTSQILFPAGQNNYNENDPTALAYSILDDIENYRRADGTFYFKLCYPGKYNQQY